MKASFTFRRVRDDRRLAMFCHGRARSTLAEIVEARGQNRLAVIWRWQRRYNSSLLVSLSAWVELALLEAALSSGITET